MTLRLTGTVAVEAELDPPRVSLGRVEKGERVTRTVAFKARDPQRVKLSGVEVDDPSIQARIVKQDGADAVEVTVAAAKVGKIRGTVKVQTTSDKVPEISLYVYGEVMGDIELVPRTVTFPEPVEGKAPEQRTLRINLREGSKARVTGAQDPEGAVACKVAKTDSGFLVELTLNKVPENNRGKIEITTTDPDERTLEAAYFVRGGKAGSPFTRPRPLGDLHLGDRPVRPHDPTVPEP